MEFKGNLMTTAMGNMPHKNKGKALELALNVDMPFFPQLPKYDYHEDLYVLAADGFPGMRVDFDNEVLVFSTEKFMEELPVYLEKKDDEKYLQPSARSTIFYDFLAKELSGYPAIRGQGMGPMSFGFRIVDEARKPIIYNEIVRETLYDFFAAKLNAQFHMLREKNENVFIWLDEPGLEVLFTCFSGYTNLAAQGDYQTFLDKIEAPVGIHLCGNPDWSFLLSGVKIKMLSMNSYGCGAMFTRYYSEIDEFIKRGGIIAWGIVPTLRKHFAEEDIIKLEAKLEEMWGFLESKGVDKKLLLENSMLTPATCCMVNDDVDETVNNAFVLLKELSQRLRIKYNMS